MRLFDYWIARLSVLLVVLLIVVNGATDQPPHHDDPLPNESVKRDPNTKLVFFGTRHGNRNPGKFLDENPKRKWGLEGDVELTTVFCFLAFSICFTISIKKMHTY